MYTQTHTHTHKHKHMRSHPRHKSTARTRTPACTLLFDFHFSPVFGFQFPRKPVVSRASRRTTKRAKRRRFLPPCRDRTGTTKPFVFFSSPRHPVRRPLQFSCECDLSRPGKLCAGNGFCFKPTTSNNQAAASGAKITCR